MTLLPIAEVMNWPGAAVVIVPSVMTGLLAIIAFFSARADRNAKLAAEGTEHVRETLETATVKTDTKLDEIQKQTDGHLTELSKQNAVLVEKIEGLQRALLASEAGKEKSEAVADAAKAELAAKPAGPTETTIVGPVVVTPAEPAPKGST